MTRLTLSLMALSLLAGMLGLSCDDANSGAGDDGRVRVVTSLELFADMVRNVGGDRVEVTALLPPGGDPHTYELAPARVADIARADVVFINGLGLEAGIEDVIRNNAGEVVELAEGLTSIQGEDEEE